MFKKMYQWLKNLKHKLFHRAPRSGWDTDSFSSQRRRSQRACGSHFWSDSSGGNDSSSGSDSDCSGGDD